MTTSLDADFLIRQLGLAPHPEGGCFRETWRDRPAGGGRGTVTCIHYLLRAGERSAWHRVDATEIWHYAAGAPLQLHLRDGDAHERTTTLGPDLAAGQAFHAIVRPFEWQSAASLGAWTLVSCIVAPAFEFDGFEMGDPDQDLSRTSS